MVVMALFMSSNAGSQRVVQLLNFDKVVAAVGTKIWLKTVVLQMNGLTTVNGGYCVKISVNTQ